MLSILAFVRCIPICLHSDGPEHREDASLALLAAARRGDVKIVRRFLRDNVHIIEEKLPNNSTVMQQARDEGLASLFEVRDRAMLLCNYYGSMHL